MKNILVTDFSSEKSNVMIFTDKLTVEDVKQRLNAAKESYTDIIDVPANEVQFYYYDEPCWA